MSVQDQPVTRRESAGDPDVVPGLDPAATAAADRREARERLLGSRQYAVRTAPPSALRPTGD